MHHNPSSPHSPLVAVAASSSSVNHSLAWPDDGETWQRAQTPSSVLHISFLVQNELLLAPTLLSLFIPDGTRKGSAGSTYRQDDINAGGAEVLTGIGMSSPNSWIWERKRLV